MSSGCRRKESLGKISRENRPTSSYVSRKEASYFVKKCGNTEMSSGCRRKESSEKISCENRPTSSYVPRQERSSDVESDSSDDVTEWTPSKRPKKVAVVVPNSVARDTQGNGKTQGSKMRHTQYPQPGIRVLNAQYEQFSYNRRPVTEEEKENAIQMAHAAASPDSLIVVMQPFHVYRSFVLTLPSWWARDHIPPKVTNIILRVEGKSWNVKFRTRGGSGMLTTRWNDFALGNLLEEFDVCLFNIEAVGTPKAAIGRFTTIVMDVSIFRVVEEAIPLTPLPTQGDESNGQSKTVKAKWASMDDL